MSSSVTKLLRCDKLVTQLQFMSMPARIVSAETSGLAQVVLRFHAEGALFNVERP
jgi:hypothetical protein